MIKEFTINVIRFIGLVLLQIFVLNNIQISGFIVPYAYLLFILMLPLNAKPVLILLLSFLMGFTMDLFSYTPGLHAAACLVIGFVRPYLLDLLVSRDSVSGSASGSVYRLGSSWFIRYVVIMVLIHHIILFFLESFQFAHLLYTLCRILGSAFFSSVIILLLGYLLMSRKSV